MVEVGGSEMLGVKCSLLLGGKMSKGRESDKPPEV